MQASMSAEAAMLSPAERVFAASAVTSLAGGQRARSIGRFRETDTGFHPDTHAQVRGSSLCAGSPLRSPAHGPICDWFDAVRRGV